MTAILTRSAPVAAKDLDERLAQNSPHPRRRNRMTEWLHAHSATLWWLLPIAVVSTFVNVATFTASPAFSDAEGTVTSRAWAVGHLGSLTPYTYTWDQPPLGWMQIAAWTGITNGFSRYTLAVLAAREAMIVGIVISTILVWFVARRLGLGRPSSALAVVLLALVPFAVSLHRMVDLQNVATPWILASVLLAASKRSQLLGLTGSAVALGVAVLSSEWSLLALPVVAVVAWRTVHPDIRRYALSVASAVFLLVCAAYVVVAVAEGQFLPSAHGPSLIGGLGGQFTSPALAQSTPVSLAILGLPFAALLLAWIVDRMLGPKRARTAEAALRIVSVAVILAIAVGALLVSSSSQVAALATADYAKPINSAENWLSANTRPTSRLIVDDAVWVDLVAAGFVQSDLIAAPTLDTTPTVDATSAAPPSWKTADFIVSTPAMRGARTLASTRDALASSVVVASFGTADQRVQVRRIVPEGVAAAAQQQRTDSAQRLVVGGQVIGNPNVRVSAPDRALLKSGRVDARIPLLLGELGSMSPVTVTRLPVIVGEAGRPIREVVLSDFGGQPLSSNGTLTSAGRLIVASLNGPLVAQSANAVDAGVLITYSVTVPAGLIQ